MEMDPTGTTLAPWATTGLAGLILLWLFFKHLPAKDSQLNGLLESRDRMVTEVISSRDNTIDKIITRGDNINRETREDFKLALDIVVKHCDEEISRQATMMKERDDRIDAAICDLREVLETVRDAMQRVDGR
jgi:hypothetical protein